MAQIFVKVNLIPTLAILLFFVQMPVLGQVPNSKKTRRSQDYNFTKSKTINKIDVAVIPTATDDALNLQEEIARQFSKAGLCPKQRLDYYKWIDDLRTSNKQNNSYIFIGWRGSIASVEPEREGFRIKINVIPQFNSGGTLIGNQSKLYSEEYMYRNGKLVFDKAIVPSKESKKPILIW